jgi:hypothetical protein
VLTFEQWLEYNTTGEVDIENNTDLDKPSHPKTRWHASKKKCGLGGLPCSKYVAQMKESAPLSWVGGKPQILSPADELPMAVLPNQRKPQLKGAIPIQLADELPKAKLTPTMPNALRQISQSVFSMARSVNAMAEDPKYQGLLKAFRAFVDELKRVSS